MDRVLTTFISALRNADVRVSPAETLDALRTVQLVGYDNRTVLKNSLALTLSKTLDEKLLFDACFDRFFATMQQAPLAPLDAQAEPQSKSAESAESQAESNGQGGGGESTGTAVQERSRASPGTGESSAEGLVNDLPTPTSSLGQLLARGNQAEISVAINAAGAHVNVQDIEVFTQKGVYSRRVMEAMGLLELQQEIAERSASSELADRRLASELTHRRDWLRDQVRNYVERQFLLHADVTGRRLRDDLLRDVRLASLDRRHHRALQEIVRRMAKRLISDYSHRRKVFRRGQLHVPRTLRRNMKYDDAIFDLHWKSIKVDRPKIFAICDVSGSVADYATFMLMFLYSLEEILPKVRSFAFSSDLEEVSALFERYDMQEAIAKTLHSRGGGATDYGQALLDFRRLCLDDVDRRSTLIVLGDARNNHGDPRTDVLKELHQRCRRLIWLNPEPRSMWDTGDSDMRHFGVYCHQVEECGTLKQLERVVARLVRD